MTLYVSPSRYRVTTAEAMILENPLAVKEQVN